MPEVGYTISGEGEGGVAGFAKGAAKVSLADAGDGTLLRYDVEAHVGGKIAQLGSRLIDGVAKGMADKFFTRFAEAARRPARRSRAQGELKLQSARRRQAERRPPPRGKPPRRSHGGGGYGNGSCLYGGKRPAGLGRGRSQNPARAVPARELRLTGTHVGCDTSQCGACVVHVDGEAIKSCSALAVSCNGAQVTTIEGLAQDGKLHPMQQAFQDNHGLQCGFCTPGMIMAAIDLVNREGPNLDEAAIRHGLEGNICRCTGYHNIVKAVAQGAREMAAAATPKAAE